MKQFSYKCVVNKNGTKMYYKRVNKKWKRISNKIGQKAEKKKKYRTNGISFSQYPEFRCHSENEESCKQMNDCLWDENKEICENKKELSEMIGEGSKILEKVLDEFSRRYHINVWGIEETFQYLGKAVTKELLSLAKSYDIWYNKNIMKKNIEEDGFLDLDTTTNLMNGILDNFQKKVISHNNMKFAEEPGLPFFYFTRNIWANNRIYPDPDGNQSTEINLRIEDFDIRLTPVDIKNLCQALRHNTTLEEFYLRKKIGNKGIEMISKVLPTNIQILNLGNNNINKNGVKFIVKMLSGSNIQVLDLSNNNIDDEGVIELAKVLKENNTLKKLILTRNNITKKGAKYIIEVLIEKLPKFVELNLTGNDLEEQFSSVLWVITTRNRLINSHNFLEKKSYYNI